MTQPPPTDRPNDAHEIDETTLDDAAVDPGVESPATTEQQPSKARLLLRGTLWQGIGQFVPLVVNILLTPYIIKGLGPKVYAVFLLISSIQALMGTVDGGIGPSANRYFTLYAGRDDRLATTRLLTTLAVIISALAVVAFGLFFWATPTIISFFPTTKVDPEGSMFFLRTMIVLVAINQVRGLFSYVLFANHRFAVTTGMTLFGYLVYVIGLVWTIETGRGLVGIAWMFMVQQGIATLFIIPSACRFLTRRGIGFVSSDVLKDFFGYSWKAQLSTLLDAVALYGDMLIVQRLRPAHAAGFGPGATFAQQLRMVPMNAYSPIQSVVGRAVGAEGERGALATFERVQKPWVAGVTGWVAVGAPAAYFGVNAWLHDSLVRDMPDLPQLPGIVASILLVGNLFWLLATAHVIWCLSVGRSDIELRYGLIAIVLNLVGTIGLIIPFGVIGSVTATAVSQLVACVALIVIMRRKLEVVPSSPFGHIPVVPALVAAVLSAVGTWAASLLVPSVVPYGALGLVVCGLGAAPALVVYALWTLGLDQLRDMAASKIPALRRS